MNVTLIWILSGLLFLVLLISLGFQPKFMNKLLGGIFLFVGISGLAFYGYGYQQLVGGLVSVARTVFSVFCMFLGRNDISTISKVEALGRPGMQILIYLTHLLALYATASTVITNVGASLIRSLNLLLLYHRRIDLIYGVSEDTLSFAEKLEKQARTVIVFADDGNGGSFSNKILKMGGILMSDDAAKKASPAFLRRIGMKSGRKELHVFALSEDLSANLRYAESLKASLAAIKAQPAQCSVSLLCADERSGESLQAREGEFGFGSVQAWEREDLLARLLIREYPPCDTLSFEKNGQAAENFEALIVGFGRTGQAVLRSLIMHAQFAGSHFHALVIARDFSQQAGAFVSRYRGLAERYSVEFREDNARSLGVFEYMQQYLTDLNYVVICTGNDQTDAEIAREYGDFLKEKGSRARVIRCGGTKLSVSEDSGVLTRSVSLFTPQILDGSRLDAQAMAVNHRYHLSEGRTAEEDWAACDYFSRLSCRASADYLPAFLKAAGLEAEEVREKGWPDDPELLENLSETEHLRWCAFHFCMGYQPMPEEVFADRAAQYRREKEEQGVPLIRVGKDSGKKLHACLIPWEELDALDEKEKRLTGKEVCYKQLDRDNILLIPDLLRGEN